MDAAFPAAMQRGYFSDTGDPLEAIEVLLAGTLEPNVGVRIDGYLEKKGNAMKAHRAQLAKYQYSIDDVIAERAGQSGRLSGLGGDVELFRLIRGGV